MLAIWADCKTEANQNTAGKILLDSFWRKFLFHPLFTANGKREYYRNSERERLFLDVDERQNGQQVQIVLERRQCSMQFGIWRVLSGLILEK